MNALRIEVARTYPQWKGCCHAKVSADDPVQLFPTEEPQYESLHTAMARSWRLTRSLFRKMREGWFAALDLEDPAKHAPMYARLLVRAGTGWASRKNVTGEQHADLDAATEQFLREFRGEHGGTREGFASDSTEDGALQQTEFLAHHVGADRATQLLGDAATQNPAFTASQRRRVLENAFDRMSEEGKLRFEKRLTEIRDGMVQAYNSGDNPLDLARKLGADLDGYERGRLRTIVRTEMAIASEEAMKGTYRANGVTKVEVIGDPATDEACTSHIGQVYSLDDDDNLPPFHPNCFCSNIPKLDEEERAFRVRTLLARDAAWLRNKIARAC